MKIQIKQKIGIRAKVALFICLVTLIILTVGTGVGYFGAFDLVRNTATDISRDN